jgi:hypothetical protein
MQGTKEKSLFAGAAVGRNTHLESEILFGNIKSQAIQAATGVGSYTCCCLFLTLKKQSFHTNA